MLLAYGRNELCEKGVALSCLYNFFKTTKNKSKTVLTLFRKCRLRNKTKRGNFRKKVEYETADFTLNKAYNTCLFPYVSIQKT